jgi:hypothetical protein
MIAPAIQPSFLSKVGLIDADYIKYHVISRCDNDRSTKVMQELIEQAMSILRDRFTASSMLFCFSGSSLQCFRTRMAIEKKYKGTRNYSEDLTLIDYKEEIVSYVMTRYPSLRFKELEADDLLCMLQNEETFIYSEDKDLKQVPGTHWNIKKGEFYEISEDQGLAFLMEQMVLGDTVDNISGIKGCGPAGYQTLLTNSLHAEAMPFEVMRAYIETHNDVTIGIDTFVENWNLLKLRPNRGQYFREKYAHAFNTLDSLK